MPFGANVAHVGGTSHRPIPLAKDLLYRHAHADQPPKSTGLDFAALAPTCTGCDVKSMDVSTVDGLCPACNPARPTVAARKAVAAEKRATTGGGNNGGGRWVDRDRIIALYTEGATVSEVWAATGHAEATIRKTLRDAGVATRDDRKRERPAKPTAENIRRKGIRTELDNIGVTSHDVKAWGLRQGLIQQMQPGLPPRRVMDAYLAAHPREDT